MVLKGWTYWYIFANFPTKIYINIKWQQNIIMFTQNSKVRSNEAAIKH